MAFVLFLRTLKGLSAPLPLGSKDHFLIQGATEGLEKSAEAGSGVGREGGSCSWQLLIGTQNAPPAGLELYKKQLYPSLSILEWLRVPWTICYSNVALSDFTVSVVAPYLALALSIVPWIRG